MLCQKINKTPEISKLDQCNYENIQSIFQFDSDQKIKKIGQIKNIQLFSKYPVMTYLIASLIVTIIFLNCCSSIDCQIEDRNQKLNERKAQQIYQNQRIYLPKYNINQKQKTIQQYSLNSIQQKRSIQIQQSDKKQAQVQQQHNDIKPCAKIRVLKGDTTGAILGPLVAILILIGVFLYVFYRLCSCSCGKCEQFCKNMLFGKRIGYGFDRYREQRKIIEVLQAKFYQQPNQQQCPICLQKSNDMITECGHSFHLKCLKSWTRRNASCPTCRKQQIALYYFYKDCQLHCWEFSHPLGLVYTSIDQILEFCPLCQQEKHKSINQQMQTETVEKYKKSIQNVETCNAFKQKTEFK